MFPARTTSAAALLLALIVSITGCEANGDSTTQATADGTPFDLSEVGIRGMHYTGEATLLSQGIQFSETEVELTRRFFSLSSGARSLADFDNPPLEYRGNPIKMRVRFGGQVVEHEPGLVRVAIDRVTPRMLDDSAQSLGTSTAEELLEKARANGITFPEIDSDNPVIIQLQISATDEDYAEVSITSDADFFQNFYGQGGVGSY